MKSYRYIMISSVLVLTVLQAKCIVPSSVIDLVQSASVKSLKKYRDVKRNFGALKNLCMHEISFKEGKYNWTMLLVTHPKSPRGAFWFLPHDNENTAFDAAVYATIKYGGGFLAVMANDKRHFQGQDPNRNFGDTAGTAKICKKQKYPAPRYSKLVFDVIDTFRSGAPYLALHNNKDGWYKNGGQGGVSILNSSSSVQSYPATKGIDKNTRGLRDEDSLVYMAGYGNNPNQSKLNRLLRLGLNTKYEVIHKSRNDCSMSNYVVLRKGTTDYYNIETEHGDLSTHKKMIDKIMTIF